MLLPQSNVTLSPEELAHLEAIGITPDRADQLLYAACGNPPTQFTLLTLAIAGLQAIEELRDLTTPVRK